MSPATLYSAPPSAQLTGAPCRFVGPRVKTHMGVPEKGWIVVTPVFSFDRDRAILVRRGWVPDTWRQAAARGTAEPPRLSGVGVVSGGEKGSSVTFANDPENDFWQLLDPAAMVRSHSLRVSCGLASGALRHVWNGLALTRVNPAVWRAPPRAAGCCATCSGHGLALMCADAYNTLAWRDA